MALRSDAGAGPPAENGAMSDATAYDPHRRFIEHYRSRYLPSVRWSAPRRGIEIVGLEAVIRHLLQEAACMAAPEFTPVRCASSPERVIDEQVVRFVHAGDGIAGAPIAHGDLVELERVRIFELQAGRVKSETHIETWSVLERANHTGRIQA